MASQDPVRFENYPPPDDTGSPTPAHPDTTPDRFAVTPYYPPPPGSGGPGRRSVLKVVVGVGVVGLFLVGITQGSNPGFPSIEITTDPDPYGEDPWSGDDEPVTMDVGDYSADLPDGWTLDSDLGNEAIAVLGDNRVLAWTFSVKDSDQAGDLIPGLVKRRLGDFTGTLSAPTDESGGDPQHAQVEATGKVGKTAATLVGQLWIDSHDNALLVVCTLVAKAGTEVANQADDIINQLSGDF